MEYPFQRSSLLSQTVEGVRQLDKNSHHAPYNKIREKTNRKHLANINGGSISNISKCPGCEILRESQKYLR